QPCCGKCPSSSGVPSVGFEKNGFGRYIYIAQLTADEETLVLGRDDNGRRKGLAGEPPRCLLEQRFFAEPRQELFGIESPGERPQARADSSAQDHGSNDC